MSKQNKANKNNYSQSGRLTPDEMARERRQQLKPAASSAREQIKGRAAGAPRGGRAASRPRSAPEE